MTVLVAEPEAKFHTVVRGDTLSAIAKTYYGNANKYMAIFEANKPMLNHPSSGQDLSRAGIADSRPGMRFAPGGGAARSDHPSQVRLIRR